MVLQTGGVELCQSQQIYHGFPGMSPNLKPTVESTPEPDVLRGDAWLQNFSLEIKVRVNNEKLCPHLSPNILPCF